jgi:hypothetical protein
MNAHQAQTGCYEMTPELPHLIERALIAQIKQSSGKTEAERAKLRELKNTRNRMARARRTK